MPTNENRSDLLAVEANELEEQGDTEGALALLTRAAIITGAHAGVFHNLGRVQYKLGMYDQAIASYSIAVEKGYPSLSDRGLVFEKLGNYQAALADYATALSTDPYDIEALVNQGTLHFQMGDLDAAERVLKRAVTLDAQVNWQLADTLIAAGRFEEAAHALDEAIAAGELRAHLDRAALANDQEDDFPSAIRHLEAAIDSGVRGARRELSVVLDNRGHPTKALAAAIDGIESGDASCLAPAAIIAESLGYREMAIDYYRAAIVAGEVKYQENLDNLLSESR